LVKGLLNGIICVIKANYKVKSEIHSNIYPVCGIFSGGVFDVQCTDGILINGECKKVK
jgi:hypothetical protein